MVANELLCVDEHDQALMAAKLLAKSQAMSANLPNEEVFRVRAISAQIGWLETSLADVAAQAVANVELLLTTGTSEGSVAIDHQLKFFESYEYGLLATWETPDALVCVPRIPLQGLFGAKGSIATEEQTSRDLSKLTPMPAPIRLYFN
jgi:hypothetical protein